MYWVCEECGWENEYSDAIKYTDCQCCGSPASQKNIADASKALNRFHQEEDRRKREDAIRLKNEKRQQSFDGAMGGFVKFLRTLPIMNVTAFVIAMILIVGSFITGDASFEVLFNQVSSNIQEVRVWEHIGESFDMTGQLLTDHFSSSLDSLASNNKYLIENDSGIQSHNESMAKNLSVISDRWATYFSNLGTNSDLSMRTIITHFSNAGANLNEVGSHILTDTSDFFQNTSYFFKNASNNITELFEKIFKR